MIIIAHLYAQIRALCHKSVQGQPIEKARHELFFMARFFGSACATASAPLFILWAGVPNVAEVAAFGCMILPLLSVVILSRTGNILMAQAINTASMIGFASLLILGANMPLEAGLAWLILVAIEATLMLEGTAAALTGLSVIVAVVALCLSARLGYVPPGELSASERLAFTLPALSYGMWVSIASAHLSAISRRTMRKQAVDYATLTDAIGDLIIRTDRSGAVLKASLDGLKLFHLGPQDLSGRGLFERIHVADRPLYLKTISDAVNLEQTTSAILRLRTGKVSANDDNDLPVFTWVELRGRALAQLAGNQHFANAEGSEVVAVLRDVTDRVLRETENTASRLETELASKWKDRFLANVSHELRTPLNAIIGFSDMLSNEQIAPKDPEKIREYAAIVRTSGQHLLEVVNTILDMSKIESGNYELDSEPFELPTVIDQTCDMLRLKAEENGVTISKNFDARVPEMTADKRAVKQILLNLVSNAVKFTPRNGTVDIATKPDGNHVLFIVTDSGIGISAQDLTKLGNPFFQASGSHSRSHEGTGLGLSVVRGLVGLHDGRISIASTPGQGTRITIRLPLERSARQGKTHEPAKIEILSQYQSTSPASAIPPASYSGKDQPRHKGAA